MQKVLTWLKKESWFVFVLFLFLFVSFFVVFWCCCFVCCCCCCCLFIFVFLVFLFFGLCWVFFFFLVLVLVVFCFFVFFFVFFYNLLISEQVFAIFSYRRLLDSCSLLYCKEKVLINNIMWNSLKPSSSVLCLTLFAKRKKLVKNSLTF